MQVGYASPLLIPDGAASLLEATKLPTPRFVKLETSTGCCRRLQLERGDGMLVLGTLWFVFAKFHGFVVRCMAEFEVVHPELMKVIIYDKTGIEMIYKVCGNEKLFTPVL